MDDPSQLFNRESEHNTEAIHTEMAATMASFKRKTMTRPILIENAGSITKLDRPESQMSDTVGRDSEKMSSHGITVNQNDETDRAMLSTFAKPYSGLQSHEESKDSMQPQDLENQQHGTIQQLKEPDTESNREIDIEGKQVEVKTKTINPLENM